MPYLTILKNNILQGEILNAVVSQKTGDGYLINIRGMEVFARSGLDLAVGQNLVLKVMEASSSQVILKVLKTDADKKSISDDAPGSLKNTLKFNWTAEARAAIKLLSALNIPITEERLSRVSRLLAEIVHKNIRNDSAPDKAGTFTEFLAVRALNIVYRHAGLNNIFFFLLPLPQKNAVYFKVTGEPRARGDSATTCLSFIVDTETLGPVLAEIYLTGSCTAASLTFEEKKGLDAAKKALAELGPEAGGLIKSLKLKTGRVSREDFFFAELKGLDLSSGINLRV